MHGIFDGHPQANVPVWLWWECLKSNSKDELICDTDPQERISTRWLLPIKGICNIESHLHLCGALVPPLHRLLPRMTPFSNGVGHVAHLHLPCTGDWVTASCKARMRPLLFVFLSFVALQLIDGGLHFGWQASRLPWFEQRQGNRDARKGEQLDGCFCKNVPVPLFCLQFINHHSKHLCFPPCVHVLDFALHQLANHQSVVQRR